MKLKVTFHNIYDYTIGRQPWQVSENHMNNILKETFDLYNVDVTREL